ncbi:MAG TPA: hypothetical protein VIU11_23330 [Nakamurella sp.]
MLDRRLTLYLDWCAVRVREPFPLTMEHLAAFTADTGREPRVGLMRVLRAEQVRRGHPIRPPDDVDDCGAGADRLLQAARRCPTVTRGPVRWTDAVTGRRDAVVLLARWLGLTRRQTAALTTTDLTDGGVLADLDCTCRMGAAGDLACPSHLVRAWSTLVPALRTGSRWRVQQIVSGGADPDGHNQEPGDGPLLFSVDRHGWAEPDRPLSTRTLTGICAVRLSHISRPLTGVADDPVGVDATASAMANVSWDDLFDRLDMITTELDARAAELLVEAHRQAAWVNAAWTPATASPSGR